MVVQAGLPQANLAPTSGSCFLQGQAAGGGCCTLASLSSSEGCACAGCSALNFGCSSCSCAWCCLCPAPQPLAVLWLHSCQAAPRGRAKGFSSAAAGQRLSWESLGGSFQSRQCWGLWAQPPLCSFFLLARAGLPQAALRAKLGPGISQALPAPRLCHGEWHLPMALPGELQSWSMHIDPSPGSCGSQELRVALCPAGSCAVAAGGAPRLGLSWMSLAEQQCSGAVPWELLLLPLPT